VPPPSHTHKPKQRGPTKARGARPNKIKNIFLKKEPRKNHPAGFLVDMKPTKTKTMKPNIETCENAFRHQNIVILMS
jgi:hypothetical protein